MDIANALYVHPITEMTQYDNGEFRKQYANFLVSS
jgi:hypothetical protein